MGDSREEASNIGREEKEMVGTSGSKEWQETAEIRKEERIRRVGEGNVGMLT